MVEDEQCSNEDGITRKLEELMEQIVETGDRFYSVTEKQKRQENITPEEARIFLDYYKAQIAE